eukprot:gene7897-7318_t
MVTFIPIMGFGHIEPALLLSIFLLHVGNAARPNFLHMVFDDFRPDLPFYGQVLDGLMLDDALCALLIDRVAS